MKADYFTLGRKKDVSITQCGNQIVISKGLANFVTIFSDLAFIVTFGNFDKELVNFGWNALVTMMFKINIRQSTADF